MSKAYTGLVWGGVVFAIMAIASLVASCAPPPPPGEGSRDKAECGYVNWGYSLARCYDPETNVTCYRASGTSGVALSCLRGGE